MELCAATLMSAQPCQVRRSPDTLAPPTESVPIQTEVTPAHACQDSLVTVLPVEVGACNTRMHYSRMRTTRSLPYPRGFPGQRHQTPFGQRASPDRDPPGQRTPGQRPPGQRAPGERLPRQRPVDRDLLEGIEDQAARQEVTSYKDPSWTDRRL